MHCVLAARGSAASGGRTCDNTGRAMRPAVGVHKGAAAVARHRRCDETLRAKSLLQGLLPLLRSRSPGGQHVPSPASVWHEAQGPRVWLLLCWQLLSEGRLLHSRAGSLRNQMARGAPDFTLPRLCSHRCQSQPALRVPLPPCTWGPAPGSPGGLVCGSPGAAASPSLVPQLSPVPTCYLSTQQPARPREHKPAGVTALCHSVLPPFPSLPPHLAFEALMELALWGSLRSPSQATPLHGPVPAPRTPCFSELPSLHSQHEGALGLRPLGATMAP